MDLESEGELKEKKMQEMREKILQKQAEEEKRVQAEIQLESILKQVLSPEAKTRLNNVRLVNSELYAKTVQAVIYLANSGNLRTRIGEEDLKKLLAKLNAKREISIKRK